MPRPRKSKKEKLVSEGLKVSPETSALLQQEAEETGIAKATLARLYLVAGIQAKKTDPQQQELLRLFQSLDDSRRQEILAIVELWAEMFGRREPIPFPNQNHNHEPEQRRYKSQNWQEVS